MEPIITHLEQIINKSIEICLESRSIWKIFFLPFFILMVLSLVLLLFPYTSVFAGANFLRFDLYPEMDFILFVVILLGLVCAFSYCATVVITVTKNYIILGKLRFALNNFEDKLLGVIYSYIMLYIFASLLSLLVVWLQALDLGILTFFVKLAILVAWFVIFLLFWFTPQAIVVDDRSLASAMAASSRFVSTDFKFVLTFLVLAGIVMEILYLFGQVHWILMAPIYVANFVVILPLLICVQTAVYITRYTLRGISLET